MQPLRLGYAAVGIEHRAARAGHVGKAGQRRLAGIAAGGHEDKHLAVFAHGAGRRGEQMRQKRQRHVLEGQRRAVIKLHDVNAAGQLAQRGDAVIVKAGVGGVDHAAQLLAGKAGQETLEYAHGALVIIERGHIAQIVFRNLRKGLGHEQSPVRAQPLHDGTLRRDGFAAARGHVFHVGRLLKSRSR